MSSLSIRKDKEYEEDYKTPPAPIQSQGDQRVRTVRDTVLQMIRTSMPIDAMFNPKLNMNLATFIADQTLMHEIAVFLSTAIPGDAEAVGKQFEETPLLERLRETFKPELLPLFYEACADVLNGKPIEDLMRGAIEGRIFTLKNALTAQTTPEALQASQTQHGLAKVSKDKIQKQGAAFIRRCLATHLKMIKDPANGPFKNELAAVAAQLVPFVRLVTRTYLSDYPLYVAHCPDDPLTFRNPTGYNRQGLVAASVMEVALQVLGYKTRLMGRSDLEPRATLATAHNIVEVTGPDGTKYIVDPAYLQFHKDICITEDLLPKESVLVLEAEQVADYVDRTIMPRWREAHKLVKAGNPDVLTRLKQNDQQLVHFLDTMKQLPPEFLPDDLETWVRSAMCRPWNLDDYKPILADSGFQEIFNGSNSDHHRAYDLVERMGFSALTRQRPLEEIKNRLRELMDNGERNSPEALSLIAQLPRNMKAKYGQILDIDTRMQELDPCINAYFRSLARVVNPDGRDFRVVYGCSGADATSVLQSTNGTELYFVDLTEASFEQLQQALQLLKKPDALEKAKKELERKSNFVTYRTRFSGSQSIWEKGKQIMHDLPMKLFIDLNAIGVNLNEIKLTPLQNGAVRIDFPWQYFGSPAPKMRSLTFFTADITEPGTYPPLLRDALNAGIDAFFMKGAFFAPKEYPQFLPLIAKTIRDSGWLITADKTLLMDTFNPEICLEKDDQHFDRVSSEESILLEELMQPPFDPLLEVGSLSRPRISRTPGTDLSYWTMVNLRKKRAQI
ncbi:MAG: hypothetical protein K1X28_10025 [Parachlamydiales bacterium]|nr:hypothetical protein [Parachlamydiales bacterium]